MDTLTERKVKDFAKEFGFEGSTSENFERYIAATYLYRYLKDDVDKIENTVLGGGADEGIDIAAIIVNGQIVFEPAEIDLLIEDSPANSARIVFIQTKISEKYDSKLISKFLHGIDLVTTHSMDLSKENKDDSPKKSALKNSRLKDVSFLIDKIIANIEKFSSEKIPCDIYYITTSGKEGLSAKEESQVKKALQRIDDYGLYSDLDVKLHGKKDIAIKRDERRGPRNIKFNFEKRQTIPDTDKIEEAYIGLVSAKDVINLLLNEEWEIRPGIFNDNVRLDLGSKNSVNAKIMDTLKSDDRGYFPFYNNGLTIVATELKSTGDKFQISGYQIVNGGQTSHQLIRWAKWAKLQKGEQELESLLSSLWVPVKIVSSKDASVRAEVSVATNLQTPIGATDIQGSLPIAKQVEEYFSLSGSEGLRYERQISGAGIDFTKTRVVTTKDLNRAVAAAVFGESSKAISDAKSLEVEDSFVWGDYPVEMYYYAAWIVYRIDTFLRTNAEFSNLKPAKYHIAMMVSCMLNPKFITLFDSSDTESIGGILRKNKEIKFEIDEIGSKDTLNEFIKASSIIIQKEFLDILQDRNLRRDDVRGLQHQKKLLSLVRIKK
ncbi:AIPR family protein [Rothia dentocariosa]|uniref:AIPR family protein n=1 Tax=Rothia dentocariosa TaxID=2047 RepID=UPI0028EC1911|nr:AIPR family protein [Rothia dentocariosa]